MKRMLVVAAIVAAAMSPAAAQTVLKFASPAPAPAPVNAVVFKAWADKVTAESDGTLKVEFTPGAVLGQHGQMLDRVKNGVIDIAFDLHGYYPGKFRKSEVVNLPFMFKSSEEGTVAFWRLYQTGLLNDEYSDLYVINVFSFPNATIMAKGPIPTVAEMKGQKLAAANPTRQSMISNLGAAPISANIADWYQSINRGVVTGVMESLSAVRPFRLQEVTKYVLEVPFGGNFAMVFMSKKKFDSLPDKAKKAIANNSNEAFARLHGKFWDGANEDGRKLMTQAGATFHSPTGAELAKWQAGANPVIAQWEKDTPNGTAVLAAFRKAIADVAAGK